MFTNKRNNDTIKVENFDNLPETNKSSIKSAEKAMNSGFIPRSVYIASVEKNGGVVKATPDTILQAKTTPNSYSTVSAAALKSLNNISAAPKSEKPVITEELEKKRIAKAANVSNFDDVPDETVRKITKLTEKTPDNYYNFTGNQAEDNKRMKEIFGAKTDFSIANVENNYNMLNREEQAVLTKKTQEYLNDIGYADYDGLKLDTDGEFGSRTKSVYNNYKSNMGYKEPEVTELKVQSPAPLKTKDTNNNLLSYSDTSAKDNNAVKISNRMSDKEITDKIFKDETKNTILTEQNLKNNYLSNSRLSKKSNELLRFTEKNLSVDNSFDLTEYHNLLDSCSKDKDMTKDHFQYGIMKMLRSLKNVKQSDSDEHLKYNAVIDYIGAILKESLHYLHSSEIKKYFDSAINVTTVDNIQKNYEAVHKAWLKVYSESCKKKYNIGNIHNSTKRITSENIEKGINCIIDAYNNGYKKADLYMIYNGTIEKIYDSNTKTYNIKPLEIESKGYAGDDEFQNFTNPTPH